ncbi:hypothetical protein TNIN_59491, partial [Trichonephila inaurata madagascariensis]
MLFVARTIHFDLRCGLVQNPVDALLYH